MEANQLAAVPCIDSPCGSLQLLCASPLHGVMCISPSFSETEPFLYYLDGEKEDPHQIQFSILSKTMPIEATYIQANKSGSSLLLYADGSIFVCVIPRSIEKKTWRLCPVNETYFYRNLAATILKAEWHPLSPRHLGLLVREGKQDYFMLYDTKKDLDVPEQKFCLTGKGYLSSSDPISSFCFSTKESGWCQFSVYFLTSGGDVFHLCPVIPQNMIIDQSQIEEIINYEDKTAWSNSFKRISETSFKSTEGKLPFPGMQGPLLWMPDNYYKKAETTVGWDNLLCYGESGSDHPIVLLKVHSASNIIQCSIQIQNSVPCFDRNTEAAKIILCEILDLELPSCTSHKAKKIHITNVPLFDCILVHHWAGSHQINLKISNVMEKGDRAILSSIEPLTDSLKKPILGLVVTENHHGFSALVWSSEEQRVVSLRTKDNKSMPKTQLSSNGSTANILDDLDKLKKKYVLPSSHQEVTQQMSQSSELRDFLKNGVPLLFLHSEFIQDNHLKFFEDAKSLVEARVSKIESEEQKLQTKSKEVEQRLQNFADKTKTQTRELERLYEVQHNIKKRISNIFKLLNYYQPRLSEAEQKFMAELSQFQQQADQLDSRVKRLERVATNKSKELSSSSVQQKPKIVPINSLNSHAIQQRCQEQEKQLNEQLKQLRDLERKHSSLQ